MNTREVVGPDDIVITGYGAITPLGHDNVLKYVPVVSAVL